MVRSKYIKSSQVKSPKSNAKSKAKSKAKAKARETHRIDTERLNKSIRRKQRRTLIEDEAEEASDDDEEDEDAQASSSDEDGSESESESESGSDSDEEMADEDESEDDAEVDAHLRKVASKIKLQDHALVDKTKPSAPGHKRILEHRKNERRLLKQKFGASSLPLDLDDLLRDAAMFQLVNKTILFLDPHENSNIQADTGIAKVIAKAGLQQIMDDTLPAYTKFLASVNKSKLVGKTPEEQQAFIREKTYMRADSLNAIVAHSFQKDCVGLELYNCIMQKIQTDPTVQSKKEKRKVQHTEQQRRADIKKKIKDLVALDKQGALTNENKATMYDLMEQLEKWKVDSLNNNIQQVQACISSNRKRIKEIRDVEIPHLYHLVEVATKERLPDIHSQLENLPSSGNNKKDNEKATKLNRLKAQIQAAIKRTTEVDVGVKRGKIKQCQEMIKKKEEQLAKLEEQLHQAKTNVSNARKCKEGYDKMQ